MSCERPILAASLGKFDGTYKIKLLRRSDWNIAKAEDFYGHDNVLLLPCGSCPACKAAHQRQWAVRCALEAQYYKDNCMVTLTYKPELRPRKLIKRDLQDFIKKLRNKGLKFRYFACGEYGSSPEHLHHPHYHIILFGYWPGDAKFEFTSKAGFPVYSSKFIESIWKRGFISVSEMSPGTAAYTAGYVDKKLGQDEFSLMSKKPGIGERYFREHLFDIYAYDNLVGSFGVSKVPRYCDKLADYAWMDIDDVKAKRKKLANSRLLEVMQVHDIGYKDIAAGLAGREMKDKLMRKKRL